MLLAQAERRLGVAERLAAVMPDGRDASRGIHLLPDILRARIFAIACGYEDADDLDRLRSDPALKLACGRLPDILPPAAHQKSCYPLRESLSRQSPLPCYSDRDHPGARINEKSVQEVSRVR